MAAAAVPIPVLQLVPRVHLAPAYRALQNARNAVIDAYNNAVREAQLNGATIPYRSRACQYTDERLKITQATGKSYFDKERLLKALKQTNAAKKKEEHRARRRWLAAQESAKKRRQAAARSRTARGAKGLTGRSPHHRSKQHSSSESETDSDN